MSRAATHTPPWIHRGLSLFCLGSLVPASFMAVDQFQHLALWWWLIFGLGILLTTAGMTVVSLAGYPVTRWAWAFVWLALLGVLTWPLAWESGVVATDSPWIWMCLGVASVWVALLAGTKWGFIAALVTGASFAAIRLTASGGAIGLVPAAQDMLLLVINPSAVIIGISLLTDALSELDASLADWQQEQAKAAVEEALVEERRRLDGIVHDEVMTALVGVSPTGVGDRRVVSEQARHAIERLEAAGETPPDSPPVAAQHLAWLVEDVVCGVCPNAEVEVALDHAAMPVPATVASAVGQAAREIAVNIDRHAKASKVNVHIGDPPGRRRGFQVQLADDGIGFDPSQIRQDRFGLRRSVRDRMAAVGGEVQIHSRPGHGTQVVLSWYAPNSRQPRGTSNHYPQMPTIPPSTLVGLIWLLICLHFVLGWTSLDLVTDTAPVFAAQALAIAATALVVRRLGVNPIPVTSAAAVVGLLLGTTLLVQSVLPQGRWPGYATWHSSVVMVLMIVLLFRGRPGWAWLGVGLFAISSLGWVYTHGLGIGDAVRVIFGPISWMAVAQVVSHWLNEIEQRQRATRKASQTANRAIAQSYSRLVLRDVWLRQLHGTVGPVLEVLADPERELTEADVSAALALERRLRDGLRASNLVAEGTQDLVEEARSRGIEVTLVDSRGSALPAAVREEIRVQLATVLSEWGVKRVVVRAAPEGYAAAATILVTRRGGNTELISLDGAGNRASG